MLPKKEEILSYLKNERAEDLKKLIRNLDYKQFAAILGAAIPDIGVDVEIISEIYKRGGNMEYVPSGLNIHHLPALAVDSPVKGHEKDGIKYEFSPWTARSGWYAVMKNSRIAAGDPLSQAKEFNQLIASLGIKSRIFIPDAVAIVFLVRKMENINGAAAGCFLSSDKPTRTGTVLINLVDNSNEYVVFLKMENSKGERYLSVEPRHWESESAVAPIFRVC
ncbi:MAG: hypothetical protein HZA37_01825 [Parcubacteria group bacterium]|nr:hypothetical protein [Parcubacteria group bacterium]